MSQDISIFLPKDWYYMKNTKEENMRITNYNLVMDNQKILTLVKESATNYTLQENLRHPSRIAQFMRDMYNAHNLPEEHLWAIAFTNKLKPIGVFEISHGSISNTIVDPKAIFQRILLCAAGGFVICHNHPSNDPHPSKEDLDMTRKVKEGADILEISMIDHIIIGDETYYSFAEEGTINKKKEEMLC